MWTLGCGSNKYISTGRCSVKAENQGATVEDEHVSHFSKGNEAWTSIASKQGWIAFIQKPIKRRIPEGRRGLREASICTGFYWGRLSRRSTVMRTFAIFPDCLGPD